jgi:hypothetical protein
MSKENHIVISPYLLIFVIILLLFIGTYLIEGLIYNSSVEHITITVENKDRTYNKDSSKWLVFTENEIFSVSDSMYNWHWRASDIYGKLKVGGTYNVKVYGYRIGLFSTYRNILSAELIYE